MRDALDPPGKIDGRPERVVEMRYFGGMEGAEIAEVPSLSKRTVSFDWNKARMLLARPLRH